MTTKDTPLMTANVNGIELRIVRVDNTPWPFSVQRRIGRKTWEQINAYTIQCDAFTQAVYYINGL